jgi:hypothetical protein
MSNFASTDVLGGMLIAALVRCPVAYDEATQTNERPRSGVETVSEAMSNPFAKEI